MLTRFPFAPRLRPAALLPLLAFAGLAPALLAQVTDPKITEWVTARSYARVYTTTANKTAGTSVTTWSGVTSPFYSDIQRVVYSNASVYLYATGMPSYVAGNWLTPNGQQYTSWPKNRAAIHRIPRTVTIPATKQKTNGSGGVLLNGVFVWANGDAQSYDNVGTALTATTATISMTGDGIWNRLAGVAEDFNFDPAKGHHPSNGAYHNHVNPIGLRYQLGDHVTYNGSTKAYAEAAGTPSAHSPLIGFANDGLPIYGPYGYATATDASSGVRRMTTGFVKRNGSTTNLSTGQPNTNLAATGRTTLPVWAASVQGKSTALASTEYGPNTTATYANGPTTNPCSIGIFAEDYDYLGDLGYTQGTHFDLNRQNVRYCVTPEYPAGTYAYFVSIDASGVSAFPDIINQEFFATAAPGQGTVTSITEAVTEYVKGGQASPLTLYAAAASPSGVTLTWPSVEGATYTASSSSDGVTYTTLGSSLSGTRGGVATYTTATVAPFYKITLSALAAYDTSGNGGVTGLNTSATATYSLPNTAPTLTNIHNQNARFGAGIAVTVTHAALAAVANEYDAEGDALSFRIESVANGTLSKGGVAVTPGSTLLASGESLVWTPAAGSGGNTVAFTVRAWDGALASAEAGNVTFAVNRAPAVSGIDPVAGTEDTALTISHTLLTERGNVTDYDGDAVSFRVESVTQGTLTKNGASVVPDVTTLAAGESLVWTPPADAAGALTAFSVVATDGDLASSPATSVPVLLAAVNDAPTLTTLATLTGGTEDVAYGVHMATLEQAADEADPDGPAKRFRIESVLSGTITKDGVAVVPGVTTVSEAESVLWTPPANANGTLAAFTVVAFDDLLASSPALTVNIQLAAVADPAEWDGSAGTGAWGTAANWLEDSVPATNDIVRFTGSAPTEISLGADRTVKGLHFSGESPYILSGQTLTLNAASLTTSSTTSIIHTIASAVHLTNKSVFLLQASSSLRITGNVTGDEIEKFGPSDLTVNGTTSLAYLNAFDSGKVVFGGTANVVFLDLNDGASLQASTAVALNITELKLGGSGTGTLTLGGGADLTSEIIDLVTDGAGQGIVNLSGVGTTATVTNTIQGLASDTLNISGGARLAAPALNTVTVTLDNGTLALGGESSAAITLRNYSDIETTGDSVVLTGPITGTGHLFKKGAGTLTLGPTHTRTGDTYVETGTLRLTSPVLTPDQRLYVPEGGTLQLDFTGTQTVRALVLGTTPQYAGTYGSLTSSADYKTAQITGTGLLVVTQSDLIYFHWAALKGLDGSTGRASGEFDDPDGDGLANLLEYTLGGDPLASDARISPVTTISGGYLTLDFSRTDYSENDQLLHVETSTDLSTWTAHTIEAASSTSAGVIITVTENGIDDDTITVKIPVTGTRVFARLKVVNNEE